MTMNRRNVLVGLGTIVAGGGAALGTGAFSSVEAERTVSVETADDADALLGLSAAEGADEYVDEGGDTLEIDIDGNSTEDSEGVNQDARTEFDELVTITNQGTNTVDDISLEIDGVHNEENILTPIPDDENIVDGDPLEPGDTVDFGLEIELREDHVDDADSTDAYDDGDISEDFDPTILITAETQD